MKLFLPKGSTEADEIGFWKERAKAERSQVRPQVRVRHILARAGRISEVKLQTLTRRTSGDFVALYLNLQSAQLYIDETNPECGLHFYPIPQMAQALEDVRDWLEQDEEGYEERTFEGEFEILGTPPWLDKCVAFAGIGQSAERFLLACGGPHKGKVLAFDHDPLGMRIVASSFVEFLKILREEPLTVANWVGIYCATEYEEAA